MLVKYLPQTDKQMNKKISILKDHGFIEWVFFFPLEIFPAEAGVGGTCL